MDGWAPFAERIHGVTKFSPGGEDKVAFTDHRPVGWYSTMQRPGFWNEAGYSVNFITARDGRIGQLVSIFDRAWGQGRDARGLPVGPSSPGVTWAPFAAMGRRNPNEYTISTENEDAFKENGVTKFTTFWTPEQYAANVKIKRFCIDEFKRVKGVDLMRFGIDSLAGHHMFDPVNRADCPGAPWRNEYRQRQFDDLTRGDDLSQDEYNELSDRRAYDILCLSAMNWRGVGDLGNGMYRTVAVAEENGMLIIELMRPDRTPYENPIRIPVPKP